MKRSLILVGSFAVILSACQQNGKTVVAEERQPVHEWKQPQKLAYKIHHAEQWLLDSTITSSEKEIVYAVNRTDQAHFAKMDTVLIPVDLTGDRVSYLPFPLYVSAFKEIDKIIFFSYKTQTFGAYEFGELVYGGATNMGREKDQTPTGLFFTNWKAEETTSTFNDEWELRWNFNIANKAGVGWHQYELPGYPASHACLRLTEKDAKYLYDWADQWVLENENKILVKGTPVIVFGSYNFQSPKPWLKLIGNPHALDISETELANLAAPYLNEVLAEQKNRESHQTGTD